MKLLWLVMLAMAQSGGFRFDGPLGRVVTPNGDDRNDIAVFCFGNPSDSEVEGRILTLQGSEVARLSRSGNRPSCPDQSAFGQAMIWTPGRDLRGGVYVYQLRSEGLTFTGTLLVVR